MDKKRKVIQEIIDDTINQKSTITVFMQSPLEHAYQKGYEAGCIDAQNQLCDFDVKECTNTVVDLLYKLCLIDDGKLEEAFGMVGIRNIFQTYTIGYIKSKLAEIDGEKGKRTFSAI